MKLQYWLQPPKWSADTWIALAALAVSSGAWYIAVDQARQTRLHNKLSVEPYVQLNFHYGKEGSGWELFNVGLGPAKVAWFEVLVDGKPQRDWFSMLRSLGLKEGLRGTAYFTVPYPGTVIGVRGSSDVNSNIFFLSTGDFEKEFRKNNHRVTLRLCYCSFYGDCWQSEDREKTHIRTDCHGYKAHQFVAPLRERNNST